MRKTVIAAAAAFAVASGAMIGQASAADLEYFPAPAPPVFVPTWAGFYVGGHLGYGEADFVVRQSISVEQDPGEDDVDERRTLSTDGLLGGVQAGYNWQSGSMVFGLEGDISFTDWGQSSTVFNVEAANSDAFATGTARADVDFLASVRGRVGFAMDSVLIYGTGGVAWADASARATIITDDEQELRTFSGKRSFNDVGFVVGAGLGWMVIPQTFSVGVEGLYYFFDKRKTLIDADFTSWGQFDVNVRADAKLDDIWVLRARADFHF